MTLNYRIYEFSGSRKSPIVLFHESLGSVDQWKSFPEHLAQATRRDCIAYDRLGHGKSQGRHGKASLNFIEEEAALGLPPLLHSLGIKRFVAYGHSVGGAIAAAFAARFPVAITALITEGTQSFVEDLTLQGIRDVKAAAHENRLEERLSRYHGDKAQQVLADWWDIWLDEDFRGFDLEPLFTKIVCPTLILHGTEDKYGSLRQAERIRDGVAGSALEILQGVGHFPHKEAEQSVLGLVSGFLQDSD